MKSVTSIGENGVLNWRSAKKKMSSGEANGKVSWGD